MVGDRLVTALGWDGRARVLWVEATEVAADLRERHGLQGRAALLGAELLVANALMAAWIKGEERLMLQLQGEDPEVSFMGEVRADGSVRGRLTPEVVSGEGLGVRGPMLAIKSDGQREMYRGVTEVEGEPVGRALERHLRQSEQVMARVRVDVVGADLERVQGVVIERLPRPGGGDPWPTEEFEEALSALDHLSAEALAEQIAAGRLLDGSLQVLEERPLYWRCTCSLERVEGMLLTLGVQELVSMLHEDHGADVTCQFCNEQYRLDETDLAALIARLQPET